MSEKTVTPSLERAFTWAFVISVGSFFAMAAIGTIAPTHGGVTSLEATLLLLMIVSGITWYITLGMIASALGKSWLVWAGLSFITAPVGPLVAYPMMRGHIKSAHQPQSTAAPLS